MVLHATAFSSRIYDDFSFRFVSLLLLLLFFFFFLFVLFVVSFLGGVRVIARLRGTGEKSERSCEYSCFDRVPGLEGFCDERYKGIKGELIMRFRRKGGLLSG